MEMSRWVCVCLRWIKEAWGDFSKAVTVEDSDIHLQPTTTSQTPACPRGNCFNSSPVTLQHRKVTYNGSDVPWHSSYVRDFQPVAFGFSEAGHVRSTWSKTLASHQSAWSYHAALCSKTSKAPGDACQTPAHCDYQQGETFTNQAAAMSNLLFSGEIKPDSC